MSRSLVPTLKLCLLKYTRKTQFVYFEEKSQSQSPIVIFSDTVVVIIMLAARLSKRILLFLPGTQIFGLFVVRIH